MSASRVLIVAMLTIGLIVGVVGGIVADGIGWQVGMVIFLAGIAVLYTIAIWKSPVVTVDPFAESHYSGHENASVAEAEQVLSSRNRGTIPMPNDKQA